MGTNREEKQKASSPREPHSEVGFSREKKKKNGITSKNSKL
jgi:hypothetical protein